MNAPNVNGALLIEASSGICLGGMFHHHLTYARATVSLRTLLTDLFVPLLAAGKATEDDATFLTVASRAALDKDGVGAVAYKDRFVFCPPVILEERKEC